MKKLSFVAIIMLFIASGFTNAQTVKVKGQVLDSLTNKSIPFATVLILNQNDSLIVGGVTSGNGQFQFKVLSQDNLYLTTSYIGYKKQSIELDLQGKTVLDVGTINMPPETVLLDEVSLVVQNTVIQTFDSKVYNVSDVEKSTAKDIYDILRTLPGVVVDENNNIRYKGASPEVRVDDIPAEYIYPDLIMIPTDNIKKIEVIDASMRSGGDSKGGIINIKMKKETSDGLSGMASIKNSTYKFQRVDQFNPYTNINYKLGKVIFFNNTWHSNGQGPNVWQTTGSINWDNQDYDLREDWSSHNHSVYLFNFTGARIKISEKSNLLIGGGVGGRDINIENDHDYVLSSGTGTFDTYHKDETTHNSELGLRFYAHFNHRFDSTQRSLNTWVFFMPQPFKTDDFTDVEQHYTYQQGLAVENTLLYSTDKDFRNSRAAAGLFYNHPINAKSRWNLNYRGRYSGFGSNEIIQNMNGAINWPQYSNHTGYDMSHSLSLRYGTSIGKWKLDAGIEQQLNIFDVEYEHYTESLADTAIAIDKIFYNILPSFTINYKIDSLQDIKLSFSKTVRVPRYSQFSTFVDERQLTVISTGNPALLVADYYNIYLGHTYRRNLWNLSSELFYRISANEISDIAFPVSETVIMKIPDNIAFKSQTGIDMAFFIASKKGHNLSLSSQIYHSFVDAAGISDDIDSDKIPVEGITQRDFGYHVKFSSKIALPKKVSLSIDGRYTGREITFSGYSNEYIVTNMGLAKPFFGRKLMVSMGVQHLFNYLTPQGRYEHYAGIEKYIDNTSSLMMNKAFYVNLKYNFRQGARNTQNVGGG